MSLRTSVGWGILFLATGAFLQSVLLTDLRSLQHDAGDRESNTVAVWGAQVMEQTVAAPGPNVSAVELRIFGPHAVPLAGTVTLRVRRAEADDDLRVTTAEARRLRRSDGTRFAFSPLSVSAGERLVLRLEFPEGTEKAPLLVRAERPEPTTGAWSDYKRGELRLNGEILPADAAFQLYARGRQPFGQQAVAAALLGGLTLLAGALPRLPRWLPLGLLTVSLPVVFALPLLASPTFLGTGDWDMNTTIHAAAERALNRERQLPGWNPYLCGGTPLIGYPEAPVFSPFFLTVLLGGPVTGFKINVVLHLIIGFAGFVVWLRRGWRTSWPAAFLGAAAVLFSSFVALHLFAGHTRKVSIAWIPWVLFFLQRAMETEIPNSPHSAKASRGRQFPIPNVSHSQRWARVFGNWKLDIGHWRGLRWTAPAAAALALMFLDGSVYLSLYTALFALLLGFFTALGRRRWRPLVAAALTVVLAGLIAGVHLGPVVASERFGALDLPRPTEPLPLRNLLDVFLDPNQAPYAFKFERQPQPWHEYGAYVGVGILLLAGIGALTSTRRLAPWLLAGAVFFAGAFFPTVQRLQALVPVFGELRNPQRMAVMVTVALALTAAVGFDRIRHWLAGPDPALARPVHAALSMLAALAIGQVIFVSSNTLASTFRVAPPPGEPAAPFRQGWARDLPVGEEDSFIFTMENTVRNHGSVNRCSVAGVYPSDHLRLPDEPDRDRGIAFRANPYSGEAFLLTGSGTAVVEAQTTQTARVRYAAASPAILALNMNAHRGWRADVSPDGGSPRRVAAERNDRLVTIPVAAGSGVVTFRYRPPGLLGGLLVTILGAGCALWLWRRGSTDD